MPAHRFGGPARFAWLSAREFLARLGLPHDQFGGAEARHPCLLMSQALDYLVESIGVGPKHRAAAPDRPAITIDPDHVAVGGALRQPDPQDFGALVDHRVEGALDELLIGNLALLHPFPDPELFDRLGHDRRRRRPALLVIIVIARALLLAPAAEGA